MIAVLTAVCRDESSSSSLIKKAIFGDAAHSELTFVVSASLGLSESVLYMAGSMCGRRWRCDRILVYLSIKASFVTLGFILFRLLRKYKHSKCTYGDAGRRQIMLRLKNNNLKNIYSTRMRV